MKSFIGILCIFPKNIYLLKLIICSKLVSIFKNYSVGTCNNLGKSGINTMYMYIPHIYLIITHVCSVEKKTTVNVFEYKIQKKRLFPKIFLAGCKFINFKNLTIIT